MHDVQVVESMYLSDKSKALISGIISSWFLPHSASALLGPFPESNPGQKLEHRGPSGTGLNSNCISYLYLSNESPL